MKLFGWYSSLCVIRFSIIFQKIFGGGRENRKEPKYETWTCLEVVDLPRDGEDLLVDRGPGVVGGQGGSIVVANRKHLVAVHFDTNGETTTKHERVKRQMMTHGNNCLKWRLCEFEIKLKNESGYSQLQEQLLQTIQYSESHRTNFGKIFC